MSDLSKLEDDHWVAADNLRANSKLTSSDYGIFELKVLEELMRQFDSELVKRAKSA